MEELVFAISTKELWNLISYKEAGLIKGNGEVLKKIVQNGLFGKRKELEENPSFKQLISYALISNVDSFYLFKRTSGQTETRLHNKFSLGVGGHMNPLDLKIMDEQYLLHELKRELFEEVRLLNGCSIEEIGFMGFLNDDTIPVGRVHIGLLYNIRVSGKDVIVNEPEKMTAEWIDKPGLVEFYDGMETWSRFVVDLLI